MNVLKKDKFAIYLKWGNFSSFVNKKNQKISERSEPSGGLGKG